MPRSTIYQPYVGRTVVLKRKSHTSYSEDIPIVVDSMFEEDFIVVLRGLKKKTFVSIVNLPL